MQHTNVEKQPPLYIFDLDGTLALIDHRRHLVEPPIVECFECKGSGTFSKIAKSVPEGLGQVWNGDCQLCKGKGRWKDRTFKPDWNAFFEACVDDMPNAGVIGMFLQLYSMGNQLFIWSGRDSKVRAQTLNWLVVFLGIPRKQIDEMLQMRPEGDFTPDEQLKRKWLNLMSKPMRKRLAGVFDDRDKVVAMWRAEGVTCFQVAPGNF
jgi:hypothetical protein